METLVANITGKVRRETLDGRRYLVAPVVLMQGGSVMNGSKGALYYPPEECAREPGMWNNVPITDGHPVENGYPVSARSPEVLAKYKLGYIFNDRWDGSRRVAEAWYDEELTRNKSPKTYEALEQNRPFDLSTGLMTDNVLAANGSQARGRAYTHVARNYRPDHVASLVGQTGACSLRDGCGVLVGNSCDLDDDGICINCGGPGSGKPGPCPTGDSGYSKGRKGEYEKKSDHHAKESSKARKKADKEQNPTERKRLMDLADHHQKLSNTWASRASAVHNEEPSVEVTNEEKRSLFKQLGEWLGITTPEPEPKTTTTTNQEPTSTEGDAMPTKKEELVSYLTTNCSCHKGKEKVLNQFDEETLNAFKEQYEELKASQLVVNTLRETNPKLKDVALNEMPAAYAAVAKKPEASVCPECKGMGEDCTCKKEPMMTPVKNTLAPAEQRLTPEEIETLSYARKLINNSKAQLVELVVNALGKDDAARKAIRPLYERMSHEDLETVKKSLPPTRNAQPGKVDELMDFFGASGGSTVVNSQRAELDQDDVLEPTINWAAEEAKAAAKASGKA